MPLEPACGYPATLRGQLYVKDAEMNARILIAVMLPLMLAACSPRWAPPSVLPPNPDYQRSSAPYQDVWDAAIDFLVDTGTEWDFIDNEMRTARFNTLVIRGPVFQGTRMGPHPDAQEYADCGTRGRDPGAGWGDLWASIAIRVRPAPDGSGLLKVVVPQVWQMVSGATGRVSCVSTGGLEDLITRGIEDRLTPGVRGGG